MSDGQRHVEFMGSEVQVLALLAHACKEAVESITYLDGDGIERNDIRDVVLAKAARLARFSFEREPFTFSITKDRP